MLTAKKVLEAMDNPRLWGATFAAPTWRPWRAVIKAAYGAPLEPDELTLFTQCTGRTISRESGYSEVVVIVGRRAGKSQIATFLASVEAALAKRSGAERYALLISQDHRASMRVLLSYVKAYFTEIPALRTIVVNRTQGGELPGDAIELSNGQIVAAYPCRPQATRGLTASVCILDELAHFISSEGYRRDAEMLHAVRPSLATTNGKLIVLSSPYAQSGALYDLHQRHWGRDGSDVLIWKASAPVMNPSLPADYLARMEREDPDAYRSEVLGEFRAGTSTLLDPDAIDQCVGDHVELAPEPGTSYTAFVDVSGGRSDDFVIAIGHVPEGGAGIVVDCLRYWSPPFDPQEVTREAARLLKAYKIHTARADKYAAEWSRSQFSTFGITLDQTSPSKSDLYIGSLLPVINSGGVCLPRSKKLLAQLRLLERRRS